ncbi:MAG: formimidoylglutamase [Candidatus Neomarinimicrobiota bacterium]
MALIVDIFEHLILPDAELFHSRNDPNDVRLGDVVSRDPEDYPEADAVIIGCPQDEGVRRNKGRTGARFAPAEIRRALYCHCATEPLSQLQLMDMGDTRIGETLEETHDILHQVVRRLVRDGKKIVVLGGGNDISYPNCSALAAEVEDLLVFNIDRHLDVRADKPRNSGTSYRLLMEEGCIDAGKFHELGTDPFANSPTHLAYVEKAGAHIHYLDDVTKEGVGVTTLKILESTPADAIFFGFDLDVVRSAEAPGVSAPGPTGLTAREIGEIADLAARDGRTRIVEISEVNPEYDVDGRTSKLAANILVRALATRR